MDSVEEVVDLDPSGIEPPPRIGIAVRSSFLRGIARQKDKFVMIVNIAEVLGSENAALIHEAAEMGQRAAVSAS